MILSFFLLGGCAARLPGTAGLPLSRQQEIGSRFSEFINRDCPDSLDADVTLAMRLLGRTEKITGTVQLKAPSFLRFSVTDPLGRPMLILVTDGRFFTLADNRKAEAVTGPVDSAVWQENMPEYIDPEDVFAWLTGRIPEPVPIITEIRGDREEGYAWLITEPVAGMRHLIRFDLRQEVISRHILQADRQILLDTGYDMYQHPSASACPIPTRITIEGDSIRGTLYIGYDRIYENPVFDPALFTLVIPPHFKVKEVN